MFSAHRELIDLLGQEGFYAQCLVSVDLVGGLGFTIEPSETGRFAVRVQLRDSVFPIITDISADTTDNPVAAVQRAKQYAFAFMCVKIGYDWGIESSKSNVRVYEDRLMTIKKSVDGPWLEVLRNENNKTVLCVDKDGTLTCDDNEFRFLKLHILEIFRSLRKNQSA